MGSGTMTLADIIRGAVGRPPWDVLDTWELWDHHNLAPTMTVCTGPQGRVLCSLLTDPTSDDMPSRWLYVDLGDDEPPTDRDTHDWLMDYMLTRMPETVVATATGWELIGLAGTDRCDRTFPVHAIHATWTRSTCATWPLHSGRWNNPLKVNLDRTTAKIAVDEVTGRWAQ